MVRKMNVPKLRFKEFNDEWKNIDLKNVFEYFSSNSLSRDQLSDSGIIKNIHYGDIHRKYSTIVDVDNDVDTYIKDINYNNKYEYCKNSDLIFADASEDYEGIGKVIELNNIKCNTVSGLHTILARDKQNLFAPMFKGYYFNSPSIHNQIRILANGFKVYGISKDSINKLNINIPAKKEQSKIARTLYLLDKKIELQTKKIEDLKLFTFNTIKDLYNDAKCDTIKIQDIATFYSGGTPTSSNKEFYSGTIPFIRSGEIHSCKTELYINEDALIKSSAKMISKGDILYALYGATSGDVSISKITGAINQAILCIKPNNNINKFYLYQVLKIKKEEILKKYLQGGQGNLSAEIIKNILIKLPSPEFQNSISKISNDLEIKLEMEIQKLNKLIELKKGLMQNMFV